MDPVNDIVVLDITPSPVTPATPATPVTSSVPSVPSVPSAIPNPSASPADEEGLLCFKCQKSNARLMRFECHCDLPVHVECAIYLKRKGYTCPFCNFTKDMRQITPESRLLPRNEPATPVRSLSTYVITISIIFIVASLLSYIIYNYAITRKDG